MAKGEDLIKFITQRVVTYIDTPVEARRERKMERKNRVKEPWGTKWFGMMPLGMKMWVGQWRNASKPLYKRVSQLTLVRWWKSSSKSSKSSSQQQQR
ncbi:YqzE family protein [Paenibacillus profundus]|uniref:YqzE family protein n=1 Tax=Paenibacillus profundus TaxID=1173085 RepID=A0ABS8YNZ3_9BACL|nr:YqzE family protein [Paenibacillus profundus]MCE5173536.1 YqzE family protein [Paenibacillus profundus]